MKQEETKIYRKIVKTCYNLQVVNYEAKENPQRLVSLSERIYHNQINQIIDNIINGHYKVIYIAGPSSAGKTTSSNLISAALKKKGIKSLVISTDDFFLDREKTPKLSDGSYDYDNVTAMDAKYYNKFISQLVEIGSAEMPIFDFIEGRRIRYQQVHSRPEDVIIIEGIHALNPIFVKNRKNAKNYKIYVTLNGDFVLGRELLIPSRILRLMRRCIRDYFKRGYNINDTVKIWKNVCRSEHEFISPYKQDADFVLDTTHIYEPLIYDYYLKPLLVNACKNEYVQDFENIFSKIGSLKKDIIPKNSLLWEFLIKDES